MANNRINLVEPPVVQKSPTGTVVNMQFDARTTAGDLYNMMQRMGATSGIAMRVCDACEKPVGAKFETCTCTKCNIGYDLCDTCIPRNVKDRCPNGYGCGNLN